MKPETFNKRVGKPMGDLFAATIERGRRIRELGFNLVEKWECEWASEKRGDINLQVRVQKYDLKDHLNPRDALLGGRTNGLKLYHETTPGDGKTIRFYDIRSLYPYVNARKPYPVGHAKVVTSEIEPLENCHLRYQGLFKCTVAPPTDLYIPVLPIRTQDKKLVFALCGLCAEEKQNTSCTHSDMERELSGTWTHVELIMGIKRGDRIVRVTEIWHWDTWTTKLFEGYINTFYAVKEQSSGWPSWVETDEDRKRHIANVQEMDGVTLDCNKVEKNAGLRQVAKLALNRLVAIIIYIYIYIYLISNLGFVCMLCWDFYVLACGENLHKDLI